MHDANTFHNSIDRGTSSVDRFLELFVFGIKLADIGI